MESISKKKPISIPGLNVDGMIDDSPLLKMDCNLNLDGAAGTETSDSDFEEPCSSSGAVLR